MKKGYNVLMFLPAALLILFGYSGCKEDEYDFSKIEPVIKAVTGTAGPMQGRHYEFTATTRGGSTYAWESVLNAEIVTYSGAVGAWKTYVYFPDVITTVDDPEVISVTETTLGGVDSDPKSFTVATVAPFQALPIAGSSLVNGGFVSAYSASPSASDKIFSAYTWFSTAGTITPNASMPWKMNIAFSNEDVGDVVISLIETTTKGMKDTSHFDVEVLEYCALASGTADMVGVWSGDDGFDGAFYPSEIETSDATSAGVTISGVNAGWMLDFWGEEVTDAGVVKMTVNADGTVVIESQYLFTTVFDNAPYEYWIEGEGRWNNCGEFPALTFDYLVYNKTDDITLPVDYIAYFGAEVFTATLVMDGGVPAPTSAILNTLKKASVSELSAIKRSHK